MSGRHGLGLRPAPIAVLLAGVLALLPAPLLAFPGRITTVAGGGTGGDGVPATATKLYDPLGVAFDSQGNLFISDGDGGPGTHNRIRKVDAATGIITTVAGTGPCAASGDGGPAISASLCPAGSVFDSQDNLYVADPLNFRVRKISPSGTITTVAGGTAGNFGDGGLATQAALCYPSAVETDSSGNLYIADFPGHRIRKVDTSGIITTVAGVDECESLGGYSGDGGPATSARLNYPLGLDVDSSGNLYFADQDNHRIRVITPDGIISTAVGGDDPCVDVVCLGVESIFYPSAARIGPDGALYITERCRVTRAYPPRPSPTRRVTTVAGLGCGYGRRRRARPYLRDRWCQRRRFRRPRQPLLRRHRQQSRPQSRRALPVGAGKPAISSLKRSSPPSSPICSN